MGCVILAAATGASFRCRRSAIENKIKSVALRKQAAYCPRPSASWPFFHQANFLMKPVHSFDSKPALQPSRCGMVLHANGGYLRDSERAQCLRF